MMKIKDILTIKEAETEYRIGRETLYGLYEAGEIQGYVPGKKKIYLYKNSIERYLLKKLNR
jgi:hypothetical protein